MKHQPAEALATLAAAAQSAQVAEMEFRAWAADEIAKRERDRQFAFRRLDLARTLVAAALEAKSEDEALARQTRAFKAELGWHSDTEERKKVYEALRPVALAVWSAQSAGGETSTSASPHGLEESLAAFEAWYQTATGHTFLAHFDHEIPEIPVVEF